MNNDYISVSDWVRHISPRILNNKAPERGLTGGVNASTVYPMSDPSPNVQRQDRNIGRPDSHLGYVGDGC